ncbi:hypothetical protein BCR44DRAFT_1276921 [Catenaria anguillulae PL171]|uniref:Uncharacterized protein n=1 Tax=Catenaria anguillulae PL171 TaxID=765915 RepID=A0A1Y2HDM2_9FUNG|nr:hypothetical protein BCR44DRAFT_1276921 [Catenaria anguillulae PL171]
MSPSPPPGATSTATAVTPVPIPKLDPAAYTSRLTAACSTSAAARDALRAEYVHAENYARTLLRNTATRPRKSRTRTCCCCRCTRCPTRLAVCPNGSLKTLRRPLCLRRPQMPSPPRAPLCLRSRRVCLELETVYIGRARLPELGQCVCCRGSVQACLTHLDPSTSYGDRRDYFLEKHAAADIDLFLYGLDEEAAKKKMEEIYDQITDAVPFEMVAIRTTHSVSICAQFPYRHIQIILRLYASPAETLMGFDVDSCAVATRQPSLAHATCPLCFLTQTNTVDMTRRSPTYESRLAKYAKRGFEVRVPSLRRDEIDPQIYERSFDKVRGLARLLLFEALGDQEVRIEYKETQRQRKGRPRHPNAGQFQARQYLRSKDLKAQEAMEATSDYSHVFIPYGPEYTASRIVRVLFKKDKNINNEWFMRKRGVRVHQHPVFIGSMTDILTDCCGACPKPKSDQDFADLEKFVHGDIKFIEDDPGRQSIGSFHPLTDDDWASDAYIPGDRAPLFAAVSRGNLSAITTYLDAHPAHDLEARDWVGRTLLHLAVLCARTDIVRELVQRGARVSAPMPDGRLPLHLAVEYGLQDIAEIVWERQVKNAAEVEKMEKEGKKDADGDVQMGEVKPNGEKDVTANVAKTKPTSALYDDAEAEELEPDVHEIDHRDWDYNMSPLSYAILYGHIDLVRWLLECGAAAKQIPNSALPRLQIASTKPLALAMLCPDMSRGMLIAEMLLERGAKVDVQVLNMALQLDDKSNDFLTGKSVASSGRGSAFSNTFSKPTRRLPHQSRSTSSLFLPLMPTTQRRCATSWPWVVRRNGHPNGSCRPRAFPWTMLKAACDMRRSPYPSRSRSMAGK